MSIAARPHFRWIVCGPPRTGAPFHIDPYKTSAWNALLVGHKRWTLYPPDVLPPGTVVGVAKDGDVEYDTPEPVKWFLEYGLPLYGPNAPAHGYMQPIEFTQNPGDLVFVPTGWWYVNHVDHVDLVDLVVFSECAGIKCSISISQLP